MTNLQVLSVGIGRPMVIGYWKERPVISSFHKDQINPDFAQLVEVRGDGIVGDSQSDRRSHGGPDKAIYFYPATHYARWSQILNVPLEDLQPGSFGENIVYRGPDESQLCIGDILAWTNGVQLRITKPRRPCKKLAIIWGTDAAEAMMEGLCGFYCEVLEDGWVPTTPSELTVVYRETGAPTVQQRFFEKLSKEPYILGMQD